MFWLTLIPTYSPAPQIYLGLDHGAVDCDVNWNRDPLSVSTPTIYWPLRPILISVYYSASVHVLLFFLYINHIFIP